MKKHCLLDLPKYKFSEEELENNVKFFDGFHWPLISKYQTLSESFIEKYSDRVSWHYISIYQRLSEEFIIKHSNKFDWRWISHYQKLYEEFIKKHINKIDIGCLMENKKVSKKTKNKIKKEINLLKEII
jgi:hypothetical protein